MKSRSRSPRSSPTARLACGGCSGTVRTSTRPAPPCSGSCARGVVTRLRGPVQRRRPALPPLPLQETIEEALLPVGAEARRQHIAMHTVFGDEVPPVLGDRVQVQQVLLNLVRNSMEAMRAVV